MQRGGERFRLEALPICSYGSRCKQLNQNKLLENDAISCLNVREPEVNLRAAGSLVKEDGLEWDKV